MEMIEEPKRDREVINKDVVEQLRVQVKRQEQKILQLESEFDRIAHDRNELNYMNQQLIA